MLMRWLAEIDLTETGGCTTFSGRVAFSTVREDGGVHSLDEADEAAAREQAIGDKFLKHIYHAYVCIGALIAERVEGCGSSEAWEHRTSRSAWRPI